MQKTLVSRALSLFFAVLLLSALFMPFFVYGAEEKPLRYCYTNASINFRSAPDLSGASKYSFSFGKHQVLPILAEVHGASYSGSTLWYKVRYTNMADGKLYVGYVHSTLVTVCAPFDYGTEAFSEFPESYRPYLAALKTAHPTWTFVALDTEKDFSAVVSAQAEVRATSGGDSLTSEAFIHKNYSSIYRSTSVVNGINAATTLLDGGTMYCASKDVTAYYMDPRNFLNEVDVFMFSAQTYDEGLHTLERIENMIKGTYMETLKTPNAEGVEVSYAQAFLDAAKATGISPFYLLTTSFSENGTVGTNLSKGNLEGGVCSAASCSDVNHRGYYNFFGIGSTPGGSPQHNGLMYAMDKGWDTAYKAIVGGASFQGDNYITNGQGTSYLKKFNVNPASPNGIWHQYMQNIQHPETEALFTFRSMQDNSLMELPHEFQIPVFKNMPAEPSMLPNTETYVPQTPDAGGENEPITKPTFSAPYKFDYTGFVSGIAPETSEAAFKEKFSLGAATSLSVSSSTVGTGTQVRVLLNGEAYYTFYAVVRGDLSGNGKIDTLDLLYLRDYLLKTRDLNSVYSRAADIDANGKVDTLDLLKLRDALLKIYTISQEA